MLHHLTSMKSCKQWRKINEPRISHQRPYRTPIAGNQPPITHRTHGAQPSRNSHGQANVESFKAGRKSLKEAEGGGIFPPRESVGFEEGGGINWEFCWEGSFVLAWMELWVESVSYFVIIVGMSRSTWDRR